MEKLFVCRYVHGDGVRKARKENLEERPNYVGLGVIEQHNMTIE